MTRALLSAAAMASLAIVLLPPLAPAARVLFAAHMAQHLILICATAPLLALVWPRLERPVSPVIAWCLFVSIFLVWHWPAAFQWAAGSEITRLFELASILASATLFWAVMLGPANRGGSVLLVVTAAIAIDLPGVVMIFAPRALCVMPDENAARFGLSALEDQQLAGLLMWVPANLVFFAFATWLFAQWMREHDSLVTS
jgi:putative membrane protein